jgi:hypothetical protein
MSPKLAVHPAADIFPMMTDDELQELAADIAENGLQVPIVLDHTGKVLIDGRNRLEACKIAQVEPQFETLPESTDIVAFIISINIPACAPARFLSELRLKVGSRIYRGTGSAPVLGVVRPRSRQILRAPRQS